MTTDFAAAWDRYATSYQEATRWPVTVVHYGPDLPTEEDLRLLGDLRGKRVLDLGCGGGHNAVAMARDGATVIGVDLSVEQLALARQLAADHEVRVELRSGDLADLAYLRADSIDLAISADAFGYVEDLGRVFRQVHRVLKVGSPLVFSLAHPAWHMVAGGPADPPVVRRSYFDRSPLPPPVGGEGVAEHPHDLSSLLTGLVRASYRVEHVVEPEPPVGVPRSGLWQPAAAVVPRMLIVRARKEGS